MALVSPGVEVKVIDESFYTPGDAGTVPMIFVATGENKSNGAGDGIAPGTLKANAGQVYLITSQKDLVDTFGDPVFKTDTNGNPVHAGEQNEYGLQAAYSFLGVSNRAFIVRADLDVDQLTPSIDPPSSEPINGTYWLDTQSSKWGIFEWDGSPSSAGGQKFVNKIPLVITDGTKVDAVSGAPSSTIGKVGTYAIVAVDTLESTPPLTDSHPMSLWYRNSNGLWVQVGSTDWEDSFVGTAPKLAIQPHTQVPQWKTASPDAAVTGSVWVKTTEPNLGARWRVSRYNTTTKLFESAEATIFSDSLAAITALDKVGGGKNLAIGNLYTKYSNNDGVSFKLYRRKSLAPTQIKTAKVLATSFSSSIDRLSGIANISGAMANGVKEFANLAVNTITGSGTNAIATVTLTYDNTGTYLDGNTTIVFNNGGSGYQVGDQLAVAGNLLGGVAGTNNLTFTVLTVSGGQIVAVNTIAGTRANGTKQFTNLATTSINGSGATVNVTLTYDGSGSYSGSAVVTVASSGSDYQIGDVITVSGSLLDAASPANDLTFEVQTITSVNSFTMAESLVGLATLSTAKTISFEPTGVAEDDAAAIASAINSAGFINVSAEVDSQNRVIIAHDLGGEIHFQEGQGSPLLGLGFAPFNPVSGSGIINLYNDDDGIHDFVASLWEPLVYVASDDPPTSLTENGRLWYSSVIDEVDILVHNGQEWVGYQFEGSGSIDASPYYSATENNKTNPTGPIISATVPVTQVDGTDLVTGDLWIDTSDIENFPTIYKFNAELLNASIAQRWVLVDKSDQTSEDGILFADARYNTAGENSDTMGTIEDLLISAYVDPDTPDPALYPKGMLLWNLRRSGFNVKEFRLNYIDTTADNDRYLGNSMSSYFPHRWVTVSSNQDDGSGSFGRKAQRKVVVKALQSMVNSNQLIRDDEGRIFNLMACPGYPELIGEMINLNFDRGLTAFVVGDTPARLTPDATSLLRWGNNELLAVEDNDIGAASYDEYMGMFYPWGFTSDNFGNNIVVPPSHMILRTLALNDQVAYPWFAPAGVRRGAITNATAVGYVDSQEGEFKTIALNNGQRDTLYSAKINPITFFTGVGLVNYGQKTRAKAASALDRINVARLVIYLRRQLSVLAKPYVFEPNDKITRDELKAAAESLLLELVGQRALYDYLVVCDETNNTPSRIDRNELWIDIAIEPVKAVEFIYIPLRLKNTGEISGL